MSKKWSSFEEQQLITENFRKWLNEDLTPHWGDKEKSHWSSSSETKPEDAPEPEPAAEPEPEPEATPQRETPGYKEGVPCIKLLHQWLENPPEDGYFYDTGNKIWREPYAPNSESVFWAKKKYRKCMDATPTAQQEGRVFKNSDDECEGCKEESNPNGDIEKSKE